MKTPGNTKGTSGWGPGPAGATGSTGAAGATGAPGPIDTDVALTYGASIAMNAALGAWFIVTVTDAAAHAFATPTNPTRGQRITLTIRNTFGAIATATFAGVFKTAGYAAPGNGFSASVQFAYNGTNWVQVTLWTVAIPN